MNALHKAPKALLELFRLRTQGRQPDEFATVVTPSVDVTDFYGVDLLFTGAQASAAAAFPITNQLNITVGPNRYFTIACSCTVGAAAGTQLRGQIGVRHPTAATSIPIALIGQGVFTTPVAGGLYTIFGLLPVPLLMQAGSQIIATWQSDAAGADHVTRISYLLQALSTG